MWQNLVRRPVARDAAGERAPRPLPGAGREPRSTRALAREMRAVRELVSPRPPGAHGQQAQGAPAALARGRRPLAARAARSAWRVYLELIADELNVHEVRFLAAGQRGGGRGALPVRPNLRAMGSRLGPKLAPVRKAFDAADGRLLQRELSRDGQGGAQHRRRAHGVPRRGAGGAGGGHARLRRRGRGRGRGGAPHRADGSARGRGPGARAARPGAGGSQGHGTRLHGPHPPVGGRGRAGAAR